MPSYNSMKEVAEDRKAALQMSPYKAYGKTKQIAEPAVLKMCGSKRHMGKKK